MGSICYEYLFIDIYWLPTKEDLEPKFFGCVEQLVSQKYMPNPTDDLVTTVVT